MTNNRPPFWLRLKTDYAYRTLFFACFSFAMSVAFGLFNGVQGILYASVWNGALAAYYILLAFLRGGVLYYQKSRKKRERKGREINERLVQAKAYRNCGFILLVLHIALSAAIAQMIFEGRAFSYDGWTIYGAAAYAFYKITASVIQIKRVRKHDDFTLRAIRSANLADGAVSVLALQTALLSTFGGEEINADAFNTATGIVVSALTVALGIFMIVDAHKNVRKITQRKFQDER
ncbi:MAG: hypothetical protein IJ329_00640 [Clostridia bacterium]|nr:hypothetical protein [Clostridia bacterium]